MTIQQLSVRIGELYNVQPYDCIIDTVWLVSDWNRLMPLAVENKVSWLYYSADDDIDIGILGLHDDLPCDQCPAELYADHNDDQALTVAFAVGLVLVAIKE